MGHTIFFWDSGRVQKREEELAREEPLEIRVRGRAISVTMRTPGQDEELAVGFLLTENVVRGKGDILDIQPCVRNELGNVINVQLAPEVAVDFERLTRHVFAGSSCGLCGKATIEAVRAGLKPIGDVAGPRVYAAALSGLPGVMQKAQAEFARTGGLHAAAIFDVGGELLVVREDVGRHNAVDKVLGWALVQGRVPLSGQILMVSGRLSFEIMQKALAGGIAIVAAVSAPSDLAVQFAVENRQTLVGFLRGERMNVYAGAQRLRFQSPALEQVTLAVLAGGAGERMGTPKGRLAINGRPILEHLLRQLDWPGPTMVVTAPQREHPPAAELFGREVCDVAAVGPLGGVCTALQNCATEKLVVVTVDMPGVGWGHLEWMIEQLKGQPAAAVMVRREDQGERLLEPFPLACRRGFLATVERALSSGERSVGGLSDVSVLTPPAEWGAEVWINLNTPGDLRRTTLPRGKADILWVMAKADKAAGGLGAIRQTVRFGFGEMGVKRSFQTLLKVNQKEGFDCPGCAWPDPDGERAVAEFCENGAKAVATEATRARVGPEFFAAHSVADLAGHEDMWLDKQGRITQPMVLKEGGTHYEPIEWEAAFALIARELNALASPDEAVFYTSGRASNEAAFLYQLFVRQFGTNNLPDCSNMCHESSGFGLQQSIGIGKATVTLGDFAQADAIFIIGQNPGTCHPRMLATLQEAARKGCKIVSVNPLAERGLIRFKHPAHPSELLGAGTAIASLFLPVRINGDVAALKGIMREMVEEDDRAGGTILDHAFIGERTEGFAAFADDLRKADWKEIVEQSGLSRALMREAAEIAMASGRMICCWAMGITQHENGVANVQTIANFALMRGQIGRPGAGLCPVRGHSNVQGDRTMGIFHRPGRELVEALGREFGFAPPAHEGLDTVGALAAMREGRARLLFALGGNLLSAAPDTEFTAEALRNCRLTAQVSTKLNRSHLVTGRMALILPCLGRTERDVQKSGEQFVTVEDTTGVIHLSRGPLEPASGALLSECAIVGRMAMATLGGRTSVAWGELIENYDRIRDHIEHVIPGFDQ